MLVQKDLSDWSVRYGPLRPIQIVLEKLSPVSCQQLLQGHKLDGIKPKDEPLSDQENAIDAEGEEENVSVSCSESKSGSVSQSESGSESEGDSDDSWDSSEDSGQFRRAKKVRFGGEGLVISPGKNNPFQCRFCDLTYTRRTSVREHELVHLGEKPFACKLCDGTYASNRRLQDHSRRLHGPGGPLRRRRTKETVRQCKFCPKSFTKLDYLREHEVLHLGETPFQCNSCGKAFASRKRLKQHMRTHTGDKDKISKGRLADRTCSYCSRVFARRCKRVAHERIHTKELPFACNLCDRRCRSKELLRSHMIMHTPKVMEHWCKTCGKGFTKISTLLRHEITHTGERKYPCAICGRPFKSACVAKKHVSSHENREVRKSHTCPICGRKYSVERSLKEHIRRHDTGPTVPCPECPKLFYTASAQKAHYGTNHTDVDPFLCPHCDKRFLHWRQLRAHKVTHTGEALFKCTFCPRQFVQQPALTLHVRTHTGEKPFKCSQCSISFARNDNLTAHMRSHTGERPFKCDHCEHAFARSDNLRTHMLSVHGVKLKKTRPAIGPRKPRKQHRSGGENDFSDGQSSSDSISRSESSNSETGSGPKIAEEQSGDSLGDFGEKDGDENELSVQ